MAETDAPYINRELSWLEFNQRVLDEARCDSVPLLERVKFLAINASNLDEFFMVRVGGLRILLSQGVRRPDPAGLSPSRQLRLISERVHRMVADQYECLLRRIDPQLASHGIIRVGPADLSDLEKRALETRFFQEIQPVVSPMAVGGRRRFPLLRNLGLHLLVRLSPLSPGSRRPRYALIPIDLAMERLISLSDQDVFRYILLEDVVRLFIAELFPGETIAECVAFRITRNADMSVDEEGAMDLLSGMERVLLARRKSECVRLEIERGATKLVQGFLQKALGISEAETYHVPGPVDPSALMKLLAVDGFDKLRYPEWEPRESPLVDPQKSIFDILSQRDILLAHPYESFDPVLKLIQEAAEDEQVVAIKITLYRTSRHSPVVEALRLAAQKQKYVTALVELKARFDEARNIGWAKRLEEDGVQVIHGVRGLKTHSKICMVVRREDRGMVRYMHFGTGNYNEITAKLYTDISYMTCDEALGRDASTFFNAVTGYSSMQHFQRLSMAPNGLREKILELIRNEASRSDHDQPAMIVAKMNSLADREVIDALYEASQSGVKIRLNVRGICCLKPGVPGLSENITVTSVVGRFLEHSRILYFHQGGEQRIFISSADWMPRNLDRRVELLIPVADAASRARLLDILDANCSDPVKGRELLADGGYRPVQSDGQDAVGSQELLCGIASEEERVMRQSRRTIFQPHRPRERNG
jgi:polyphosphate kinase